MGGLGAGVAYGRRWKPTNESLRLVGGVGGVGEAPPMSLDDLWVVGVMCGGSKNPPTSRYDSLVVGVACGGSKNPPTSQNDSLEVLKPTHESS